MLAKALSHVLFAASVANFLPIDGAILELQAGVDTSADTAITSLYFGPVPSLPLSVDRRIPPPIKVDLQSFGVVTSAESAVVVDAKSNTVLYAKNPNELRSIGSISKLMAALVFLDTNPNLQSSVMVTPTDFAGTGRVYLHYNDGVKLRDVLGASLVGSDNTATLSLVRHSGLSLEEFVARMNTKAAELGMVESNFADPSGLSALNVSTVGELVVLLAAAQAKPEIVQFMQTETLTVVQASGRAVSIPSTNALLGSVIDSGDYTVTAGKTGYIPQAGYCLATAIEHDGHEIYVIVLGAEEFDDRFTDATALAGWTFKTFEWPKL